MDKKILIIGESFMNLKMQIDPRNTKADTTEGGAYSYHAAGKSVLTAVTVSKLGGTAAFCTKLGKDANGDQLIRYYGKCGLSPDLMTQSASAQTGLCVSVYDDLGNHTDYLSHGAGSLFSREDVDNAFAVYPDALIVPQDSVRIPYETEAENVESEDPEDPIPPIEKQTVRKMEFEDLGAYAIEKAGKQNVDLIMEYSETTAALSKEALKNLKVLIISGEDVFAMTGFYADTVDKALRALAFFKDKIPSKYYVICNKSGSLVYDGMNHEFAEPPQELIRASGDRPFSLPVFTGAFTAEFYRSRRPMRAARYAQIVTLLAYSQFRTLDYIPSRKDVEACLEKYRIDLDS